MSGRQQIRTRLEKLLLGMQHSPLAGGLEVFGITLDSREVREGDLFVALKGGQTDARKFIPEMLDKGAAAVLIDADDQPAFDRNGAFAGRVIEVKALRASLSQIAGRFYRHPARLLRLVGVTGTNGKTSIAWYLAQVFEKLGLPAGVMGTLGAGPVDDLGQTGMTTPDAVQVQQALADMLEQGIKVVCIEVSSHGLVLSRVAALNFETLIYSNLSPDHLDFHQTMEQYAAVKTSLFENFDYRRAVVNSDDELGARILKIASERGLSYGIDSGELRAEKIAGDASGLHFEVHYDGQRLVLNTGLIGRFNVCNLLAVIGGAISMGYCLSDLGAAIEACKTVPGRMQRIDAVQGRPAVVVDYAHTPDALEKALQACRSHCRGALAVVFGCGGDRDREKRPQMGRIAELLADRVFLTDDNPRSERPGAIVADIVRGMSAPAWILHDRAQAIYAAINGAQADDWVLIAGKGHESYQLYADRTLEFDDARVAAQVLERQAA